MTVVDFRISNRGPYAAGLGFGEVGPYEQVDGTLEFAVDPAHPANARIVDLALAPRDGHGQVRFSADFSVLMPVRPERGRQRLIVELPNRGRRRIVPMLNMAPPTAPVTREAHPGDGFLFKHGYTIASIGWQWDVYPAEEMLALQAPVAMQDGTAIGGQTMVEMRPSRRETTRLLADRVHRPLPVSDPDDKRAVLYVRDYEDGEDSIVPRDQWRFARETTAGIEVSHEHVYLQNGFEPGKIYQLVYHTDRAPIAGAGLIALRDVAAFLRTPSNLNPTPGQFIAAFAYGVSQTGRMQRHFISLGLNRTEQGQSAYEGMLVHIAGARRGAFNHRFAQPSNQTTPIWGHLFPFADLPSKDTLTGATAGLLDSQSALGSVPKIFYTNSAAEYWRGDAALAHMDTAAKADLAEAGTSRSYLFASTQHTPGYLGQPRESAGVDTISRYPLNVLDYRPLQRASLLNLDRWCTEAQEPPPSRHPRLADNSAVKRELVLRRFAELPNFQPPDPQRLPFIRTVDMGTDESVGIGCYPAREGEFYPALVSAVDSDGNETAGIRLPDLSVPVATHSGWNPRDPKTGSPDQIVPMNGVSLFFALTAEQRQQNNDPRPSIEERYADRAEYERLVRQAASELIRDGYLLEEDLEICVGNALDRYDATVAFSANGTAW